MGVGAERGEACFTEDDALAFAGGLLDEAAARRVEAHAEVCDGCRELLSELARARVAEAPNDGPFGRGSLIGRYVVLEPIGAGAMGDVFSAFDPALDRRVALKLLRLELDEAPAARRLLKGEAQLLARLNHPNVVTVYDVGLEADQLFVALELVDGSTLRDWLKAEPRAAGEVAAVFAQAGRGLGAAHRAGLVHRDFKPDNVLVGRDGRVRVTDFGLAHVQRVTSDHAAESASEGGLLAGTPAYMAPEQRAGSPADRSSDQFSFCVALHEALFGTRPTEMGAATDAGATAVPQRLRRIVQRGLSPAPRDRYPSMEALVADLEQIGRADRRLLFGLGLVAALVLVPLAWRLGVGKNPCAGAAERLYGVWDRDRRHAVEVAFAGAGKPYGAAAFQRVAQTLDAFADRWRRDYLQACEATLAPGGHPIEVKQTRLRCLGHQLDEVRAFTSILTDPRGSEIARASEATLTVTAFDRCAPRAASGPVDRRLMPEAATLRGRLAEATALYDAGRSDEALEVVGAVVDKAGTRELQALKAEALHLLGMAYAKKGGAFDRAERSLYDAAVLAETAGEDLTAAS
jgi:tRNA A-37 threonylcarbamoyl transferase component Bud32